ncbi:MAG: SET domain-containing protein [Bacteroidia bacterium]|nr:SET domain-containing protein [Bacteroidia bacterium]
MLVVRKSRIPGAGKGLFTTSRIRRNDIIVEYKGEKMTWKGAIRRYGKNVDYAPYLYYVSNSNCVDAAHTKKEMARYANDANGPNKKKGMKNNCVYRNIKGVPHIVAVREISPNSEILVDYGADYWKES